MAAIARLQGFQNVDALEDDLQGAELRSPPWLLVLMFLWEIINSVSGAVWEDDQLGRALTPSPSLTRAHTQHYGERCLGLGRACVLSAQDAELRPIGGKVILCMAREVRDGENVFCPQDTSLHLRFISIEPKTVGTVAEVRLRNPPGTSQCEKWVTPVLGVLFPNLRTSGILVL